MLSKIRFSIAIPAYKSYYLKECIDSILVQSYEDFELIIVNDASPEDLDSIVSLYSDERIHYYRNKENCGAINVVDNWNKCLEYASGDYIICMGDDDCLRPNCLEQYVGLIEKYPKLGVYHAWTEIIDENSVLYDLQAPRPEWESSLSLLWNRWNGRDKQFIGDFCFSVPLLKQIGGFINFPLAWASDDVTAVKCAQFGGIANTQIPCFQYRQNRYTISSVGKSDIKLEAMVQEKEWYVSFLREYEKSMEKCVPLDYLDIERKYYILINKMLNDRFCQKQKEELIKDMSKAPWKIFYWLRFRNKHGISIRTLFVSFFYGTVRKISGK